MRFKEQEQNAVTKHDWAPQLRQLCPKVLQVDGIEHRNLIQLWGVPEGGPRQGSLGQSGSALPCLFLGVGWL